MYMMAGYRFRGRARRSIVVLLWAAAGALLLTGCLEQIQTTRIPSGSLSNFLLHLQQGELDDARTYFAPGLVTPSAELDASIKKASERVRAYEVKDKKPRSEQLEDGQLRVTISGQVRRRAAAGQPTSGPDEGWQQTDIITARMVERGPGWRILDFELKCCP
jgi:hypothetical protein